MTRQNGGTRLDSELAVTDVVRAYVSAHLLAGADKRNHRRRG
jgi:hypothetical protein